VLKDRLAAEELKIRVLDPTLARLLIEEVAHVLEDEEPGNEPRRQWWLSWPWAAHRAKAPAEKRPISLGRKPDQRMSKIDDLRQWRSE
jgi:hypothetical protein